jgi:hypothetical protein
MLDPPPASVWTIHWETGHFKEPIVTNATTLWRAKVEVELTAVSRVATFATTLPEQLMKLVIDPKRNRLAKALWDDRYEAAARIVLDTQYRHSVDTLAWVCGYARFRLYVASCTLNPLLTELYRSAMKDPSLLGVFADAMEEANYVNTAAVARECLPWVSLALSTGGDHVPASGTDS